MQKETSLRKSLAKRQLKAEIGKSASKSPRYEIELPEQDYPVVLGGISVIPSAEKLQEIIGMPQPPEVIKTFWAEPAVFVKPTDPEKEVLVCRLSREHMDTLKLKAKEYTTFDYDKFVWWGDASTFATVVYSLRDASEELPEENEMSELFVLGGKCCIHTPTQLQVLAEMPEKPQVIETSWAPTFEKECVSSDKVLVCELSFSEWLNVTSRAKVCHTGGVLVWFRGAKRHTTTIWMLNDEGEDLLHRQNLGNDRELPLEVSARE